MCVFGPLATVARSALLRGAQVVLLQGPWLASTLLARESLRLVQPRPPSPRSASPGPGTALPACKPNRHPLARLPSAPLWALIPSRRFPCVFRHIRNIITNQTMISGARRFFLVACCCASSSAVFMCVFGPLATVARSALLCGAQVVLLRGPLARLDSARVRVAAPRPASAFLPAKCLSWPRDSAASLQAQSPCLGPPPFSPALSPDAKPSFPCVFRHFRNIITNQTMLSVARRRFSGFVAAPPQ